MTKKKKIAISIIITLLIIVVVFIFVLYKMMVKKYVYKNTQFGYQITYSYPWSLAPNTSLNVARIRYVTSLAIELGCINISDINTESEGMFEEVLKCINDNEEIINKKYNDYNANWNIHNSNATYLINIREINNQDILEKDQGILNEMKNNNYYSMGVNENMISIYLTKSTINYYNFADKKLITNADGLYLATDSLDLPSGIKAYQIDARDSSEGYEPGLEIYIPYKNNTDNIDTLVIETNVIRGSEEENDFYDIVNSLVFTE